MRQPFWRSQLLIRVLMALTVSGLALVTLLEFRERELDHETLEAYWQEDLSWTVSQMRFETARLMIALHEDAQTHRPGDPAPDHVVERYDIVWSRHALFEAGVVGRRLSTLDNDGVIERTRQVLLDAEPAMLGDAPYLPREIAGAFAPLLPVLQVFTSEVSAFEESWMVSLQGAILQNIQIASVIKVLSAVSTVLLVTAALMQARVDRRQLARQKALTSEAKAAADTRQRFLTMMSHELRTPMNGVLGMLGVLEHAVVKPKNRAMIAEARRSGMQMVGLLEDILELSAHETQPIQPSMQTLTLGALAADIERSAAARCGPEAMVLTLESPANAAVRLDSDAAIAATRHTVSFIVTRLMRPCCAVRLRLSPDGLVIRVTAPAGAVSWDPDALFGALRARGDSIETEAIGAALARSHIQRTGGDGHVRVEKDGAIAVTIAVPVTPAAAATGHGPGAKRPACAVAAVAPAPSGPGAPPPVASPSREPAREPARAAAG